LGKIRRFILKEKAKKWPVFMVPSKRGDFIDSLPKKRGKSGGDLGKPDERASKKKNWKLPDEGGGGRLGPSGRERRKLRRS